MNKLRAALAALAVLAVSLGGVVTVSSGDAHAGETLACKRTEDGAIIRMPGVNRCPSPATTTVTMVCEGDAVPKWGGTGDNAGHYCDDALTIKAVEKPDDSTVPKYTCPDGQRKNSQTATGKTIDYTEACKDNGVQSSQASNLMGILNTIINVVIGLVGFVAVVMIIVGGIQYTTSSGDTGKTTKAKNTIMYGVVGLVISLLAFAIVNFILANVFNAG